MNKHTTHNTRTHHALKARRAVARAAAKLVVVRPAALDRRRAVCAAATTATNRDTSSVVRAAKELGAGDGKHEEEKGEQADDAGEQLGGLQEADDDAAQAGEARDRAQRPQRAQRAMPPPRV